MTNENVIKEIYAAINENNIQKALQLFDPEIVRVEPGGTPSSGTYNGIPEMEAKFLAGRNNWAEGSCTPVKLTGSGNKVLVDVHVLVRLKNKTDWIDARTADVFRFRQGKILEMRSFVEKEEALKWFDEGP